MTKTTRDNQTIKALQTELNNCYQKAKHSNLYDRDRYFLERQLIGAVNNRNNNLDCEAVKTICKDLQVLGEGGTKIAYGTEHLAICFISENACKGFGNQIAKQVNAYKKIALTPEAKYFNPIASYGLHRGDKLTTTDDRYLDKSFIVSPRAELFNTIEEAVKQMFESNRQNYTAASVEEYINNLEKAAHKFRIGDLHSANIGLIFDYSINKYRAVIIDYGLYNY